MSAAPRPAPATSPLVYFNGSYVAKSDVRITPDDRGFLFADGVYEVVRIYDGRPFELEAHLRRFGDGLRAIAIAGVDVAAIGEVVRTLVARNGLDTGEASVYLQVTRGSAPRVHAFPDPPVAPTVYAEAKPFAGKGDPERGVAVITVPDVRWARCDIKSVALLPNCLANERARAAGALEAVFVRDGVALEGTSSSLFAVLEGEVRTAPLSNYILPSVSRAVVLRLCAAARLPHRETPVYLDDLRRAEEVFLASTTLEVMPVVRVDGAAVGDGRPGALTARLQQEFHAAATGPAA